MVKAEFKRAAVILSVFSGVIGAYTGVSTVMSQIMFPRQANGSLIREQGKVTGSTLIGKDITDPKLFIGRPAYVTNLSQTSAEEQQLIEKRVSFFHKIDSKNKQDIPVDLVTGSASGNDAYISYAAAQYQVKRIMEKNNLSRSTVQTMIEKHTTNQLNNILGEKVVNVMALNVDLEKAGK